MIDLTEILSYNVTHDALLSVVALLLRSIVKTLKKIYATFNSLEDKITKIVYQNEVIITQHDSVMDKLNTRNGVSHYSRRRNNGRSNGQYGD